jgi:hypothetical protein
MNRHILQSYCWFLFLTLAACVKTELIPEELEPTLRVSPAAVTLQVGESTQLTGVFTNAMGEDQSALISWVSRAPAIAELSSDGQLSGLAFGQTWAVATAPGGLADSILVTVVVDQNAVARVEILNAPATLEIGASATLQAKAFNALDQELAGQSFNWSSTDSGILQVTADGQVTGLTAGTASIRAETAGINSLPVSIEVLPAGGLSRNGSFMGNSGYTVSGTATLEQSGNMLRVVLQSDFAASNGPMLGVYLATTASGGLNSQNSLALGNLQANTGMQEYAVPAGVALQDYDYVVIYCIPFNVRFGTAQLNN